MNRLALALLSTAGLALSPWRVGAAQGSPAPFQIIVENTDKGVNLQCTKGCVWRTATYTCETPSASARMVISSPSRVEPLLVIDGMPVENRSPSTCLVEVNERGVTAKSARLVHVTVF